MMFVGQPLGGYYKLNIDETSLDMLTSPFIKRCNKSFNYVKEF